MPLACRGVVINFNISANFNNSQLNAQCGLQFEYPDAETIDASITGIHSLKTNEDDPFVDCSDPALIDTPTVKWSSDVPGEEITARVNLNFEAEGDCFSVARSGDNTTVTYEHEGICGVESDSTYITATLDGSTVRLNSTDLHRIRADGQPYLVGDVTITVSAGLVLTQTGQNIDIAPNPATTSNDTSCVSCSGTGENATLNVKKLCSETQCEVNPDPPESNPPPFWVPCVVCGSGGDGGGGGDDGGGSPPPVVPIVPLFPPFFVPIVPPIIGVPGSGSGGGGGGGGGGPGLPALPIPIVTNCTEDVDNSGGMRLPNANFSVHVPCCHEGTHRWTVLETGSIPNYQYICKRIGEDSYAWVANAEATGASFNVSTYNLETTQIFTNNSSILGDSTSQFVWHGPVYLGDVLLQDVIINGTLEFCPATPTPFKTDSIEACDGGPPTFNNGFIVTSTPPSDPLFPPVCTYTCDGPSTAASAATIDAFSLTTPPLSVNGGGDFCLDATPGNQYLYGNELESCDGTTPIRVAPNIYLHDYSPTTDTEFFYRLGGESFTITGTAVDNLGVSCGATSAAASTIMARVGNVVIAWYSSFTIDTTAGTNCLSIRFNYDGVTPVPEVLRPHYQLGTQWMMLTRPEPISIAGTATFPPTVGSSGTWVLWWSKTDSKSYMVKEDGSSFDGALFTFPQFMFSYTAPRAEA
jgi:hypothetical protein